MLGALRTWPAQFGREFVQDCRHAFRQWCTRPLHTAFVVAVSAIAVGAYAGTFSVLNALLLRPLPFEPDRLAAMKNFGPLRDSFHEWRQQSAYLSDATQYNTFDINAPTVA